MSNNSIKQTKINPLLTVVTQRIEEVNTATIGIWADGGACKEDKNSNGLAHFLEHMLFKGTQTRDKQQIVVGLERLGAYLNAYTSSDSVAYHFSIAPSKPESIQEACDILLDMFLNSKFPVEELEKEKQVVLQEMFSGRDDLDHQCAMGFYKITYGDCYLGREIVGTEENIKAFSQKDLLDFIRNKYKKIYFVAVGNIDEEKIINQIKGKNQEFIDFFKEDPNPTQDIVKYNPNYLVHQEVKEWANQAHVAMGWESVNYNSKQKYVVDVISCILGGNMSSILCQTIRDEMGLVYTIGSYADYMKETGYMMVYFATFNEKVDLVIDTVNQKVQEFMNFTDKQLEDAKNYILGSRIRRTEDPKSRAFFLGEYFLKYGNITNIDEYVNGCQNITRDDIRLYWEKYLNKPADKISKILTK